MYIHFHQKPYVSADYSPLESILLDCGSSALRALSYDGRNWTSGSSYFIASNSGNGFPVSRSSSEGTSAPEVPYMTARMFHSNLHISEHEEDGSLYQTQNSIHALWDKFAGVNSDKQSDAPASSSQASAPPNFNAASDDIQSGNIVTLAPSVLYFKEDTDKDHRRIKTRENDSNGDKSSGLRRKGRSTAESRSKFWNEKPEAEVACAYGSSEDEDVCPTCLDEYERENPRIVLQCSHSYHLGSIYEWMERSENRPICGKKKMFDEAT
ncbi:E3 ubiquitin-protein ligase RLIM-like [Hibiscus syriacus]|uniref:E3 ubiquitin-protein ligase RLIM-like n=1 Tax=Hibiscus syriacus TaxID=106335 RepID=UPI001923C445|nr:E3 ubiquitin-protein ligase RLIM-like [Hibiscus syriacus]